MSYSEPARTAAGAAGGPPGPTAHHRGARAADGRLSVGPISATEHLAFVRAQRSVSFLQTPAWGRVKTEWRNESLGWFDGRRLVGAGLVLHRPVPRLERFTPAYLSGGPADPVGAHVTGGLRDAGWLPQSPGDGFGVGHPQLVTARNAPWTAFCAGHSSRRTAGRNRGTIRTSTGPRCSTGDTWPPGRATAGEAPST